MSELSLSSQQQLTQALAQLNKVAATSPVAQQARQVIVEHLSSSHLLVSQGAVQQRLSLSRPLQATKLQAGQSYTVSATPSRLAGQGNLSFYNLPLEALSSKTQTVSPSQLAQILEITGSALKPNSNTRPVTIQATVTRVERDAITLQVNLQGKTPPLSLVVNNRNAQLAVGQQVQLQLSGGQQKWQLSLTNLSKPQPPLTFAANPKLVSEIVKLDSKISASDKSPLSVDISSRASQRLSQVPGLVNIAPLPHRLSLISGVGGQLSPLPPAPVASITVNQTQINALMTAKSNATPSASQAISEPLNPLMTSNAPLPKGTPLGQNLTSTESLLTKTVQNSAEPLQSKSSTPPIAQGKQEAPVNHNSIGQQAPTSKGQPLVQIDHQVRQIVEHLNSAQGSQTAQQVTQKFNQLHLQIQSMLRQSSSQANGTAVVLNAIIQALKDDGGLLEPALTKPLLSTVSQQLEQSIMQGKLQDPQQLRQLLTQPALNLSAASLTQVQPSSGMLSGLITLLQMTLAGRLGRSVPAHAERLTQLLTTDNSGKSVTPSVTQANRTMQDLQQLDQKHQLLKQIGRLFSQHQSAKLGNAEQLLQGQESFYYVLPGGIGNSKQDIELLIRRQQEHSDNKKRSTGKQQSWQLTLKLPVGDLGEILSKAKLTEDSLEIDFYTSNEVLKNTVLNFLPLLKKRFAALGIEVEKSQCQLGKIPDTLRDRPYHLFQTQA